MRKHVQKRLWMTFVIVIATMAVGGYDLFDDDSKGKQSRWGTWRPVVVGNGEVALQGLTDMEKPGLVQRQCPAA